jgi:hypothetical protein
MRSMRTKLRLLAMLMAGAGGCATAPPLDNPVLIREAAVPVENPILVSPGTPTGASYRDVFERCIDVLDDDFVILSGNPYEGRIITLPRMAPGYEQFWKGGNPDPRSRLMATFQTVRQTAVIEIRTGERGGYFVSVIVQKEQEDLPRPSRQITGGAVFQEAPTVDRQLEVIGEPSVSPGGRSWYPIGRDYALEQELLQRIRTCR